MSFNVIIATAKTFADYDLLCRKCDTFFSQKPATKVICRDDGYRDDLGYRYAVEHGIDVLTIPADWEECGNMAEYFQNLEMLDEADALIAFWDGKDHAVRNIIRIAKEKQKPVRIVRV